MSKKVFMNLEKIRLKHKKKILSIAKKYGLSNLRVFGSYAKGLQKKTSDIDILYSSPKDFSLMKHAAVEIELSDLLKIKVQLVSDKAVHHLIRDSIYSSAVAL